MRAGTAPPIDQRAAPGQGMFDLRKLAHIRLGTHNAVSNLRLCGQHRAILQDGVRPDNRSRSDQDIFSGQVQLDIEYIESQSFWGDVKILLKTVPAVLSGRGAY